MLIETCIEYCEPDKAFISSNERRWINRIHLLAAKHPDEMIILKEPDENQGVIYAKFPAKWARVSPPKQILMSEAERENRAKRLLQSRQTQTSERKR